MTNKLPPSNDWQARNIDDRNTRTVHAFLIDETRRRFNAEYVPGGKGSKSQRWRAEQGMIKRELDRRGAKVVRKFIEICWAEYYTPNPKQYPYPTFGFMLGFMDRYWTQAEREVAKETERAEIAEQNTEIDTEWF